MFDSLLNPCKIWQASPSMPKSGYSTYSVLYSVLRLGDGLSTYAVGSVRYSVHMTVNYGGHTL